MSKFTNKIVAIATALSVMTMVAGPAGAQTTADLQALINSLTSQLASLTAQLAAIQGGTTTTGGVTGCTISSFTRDLSQGATGADVKCLQVILNSDAATKIASTGAGSPGSESTYFGALTKAAVVKFQNKYASEVLTPAGLTAGTGYVGAKTRAKLNTLISGGTVVTPGAVLVALAPTTPAASAVAQGSADVAFSAINFSAGAQAYTVNTIVITRSGVSVNADVTNLKLYDGATQVGSTQALNSATNKATFTNLNWTVAANTVKTLTVKGTVGTNAGDSIVLGIASASDIAATVALTGTFPIYGNPKTLAGTSSAVGTFTVASTTVPAAGTVLSGAVEQQVATFNFTSATEGFNLNSLKLTQVGTAGSNDIMNVKIKYGATVLGTVASLTGSSVTFSGSPLLNIPVGQTKSIDVYVDTASGVNTSRTIQMEITQAADVVAVGANSGGQVTAAGSYPMDSRIQTFGQGTLTVASDASLNPPAQSYVIGTTNRAFNAIKFSTGATEGVRLTQLSLTLGGTITATDLSNVSLYDGTTLLATGVLTGSTVQFGQNTVNSFDASGLIDIPASTNKTLTVKADISSGASSGATGTLSVTGATQVKADGLLSMMDIPTASISASAAGNLMTISAKGTLIIALDGSSLAAQIVPKGTANKTIASYSLTAGSGENALVSAITVRLYKDSATEATSTVVGDLTSVSIWDGTTQLGTTVAAPVASAAFNASLIVPAGTKKVLSVQLTVPTGSSVNSFHADLATSDVSVTGVSSNATISPTGGASSSLMTVTAPSLAVVAAAVPAASNKVSNTRGVAMTTLLLTAGTAEDVKVSQVKVSFDDAASIDGTSAADSKLGNVTLMDGSTVIGGPVSITDGTPDYVLITGITNLTVPAGQTKAITVVVDITGTTGTLYSGVLAAGDIAGSGAISGTAVSSTGATKVGAALAIAANGRLSASVDSNGPQASNVAVGVTQGAQGVSFSRIKLAAETENIKVSSIMFTSTGGRDSDFGAVYLYDAVSNALLGTTYMNATTATFNFSAGNEIIVPANGNRVVTVKADLMGIGAGATTADAPKFYIAAIGDIVAAGVSSQQTLTVAGTTTVPTSSANFNAQTLYKTTASVALVGPAGGLSTPASNQNVLQVTVTNNGAYDLTVTKFTVTPYFTGTSTASVSTKLYSSADNYTTAIATGTASTTSGVAIALAATSGNTVPAGTSRTFKVLSDTTGSIPSGSRSYHMDIAAISDFGWTPDGGSEVTTLTPGLPINGPTLTY